MIYFRIITVLVLALAWPIMSFAQETQIALGAGGFDSSQPVEVSADALSVDQSTGQAIFDGNVLIVQGEVRMSANRVEIEYSSSDAGSPNGIEKLTASGGVTFVTATDAAEAREAVYAVSSSTVTLIGSVLLTQGQTAISGDKLVVDLNTGSGKMEGRIRTVIGRSEN